MQNTKLVLVVADTLGNALVQLDTILKTQFKKIDCRIENLLCVPEARPTRIHGQMQVVCNLVCVLVSDDQNVIWPGESEGDAIEYYRDNEQAAIERQMKTIKE